jgi:predicted permease
MTSLARDARYALRSLAASPVFTAVAVLSLALGIGANTAIFSLTDQVLLRLLPVKDPESLVMIAARGGFMGNNRGSNVTSYPMFKDYRNQNQVFTGVMCLRSTTVNMAYDGPAERVEAELVSGNYFEVLGVQAALGRTFTMADETNPGANPVVVLNYDYWRNRFKGDRNVIGATLRVNGFPMTIVGVAAPGYHGVTLGYSPRLHIPVTMKRQATPSWDELENRRSRWAQVYARLKPGVSRQQAEASIRTLHKQIISEEVRDASFSRVTEYVRQDFLRSYAVVQPGGQGYSGMRRALEAPLLVLTALVGIVLLIACANVSNLLVARAAGRQKEIAVRLALGAGRFRLVRQLMMESLLLALAGGALGIALACWVNRALLLLAPTEQIRLSLSPDPDPRTLLFAFAVSCVAALVFGLLPAVRSTRADLASVMKEQAGAVAGGHGARLRKVLVVVQVMLSLLLLVGSGLFIQSLQKLRAVDPGFRATNLVRFKLDPMLSNYGAERTREFYRQLQQRLERLPGVESAALAMAAIMEGDTWNSTITVEGYRAGDGENMNPNFNSVSPHYFRTLSIPVKLGRDFDERDRLGAPRTVLVNETFVKRYFPDRSPLGYHIGMGAGPQTRTDMEIVGVVADTKYEDLREPIPRQVFVNYAQSQGASGMTVYVRTTLPSERMFSSIRAEMRNLDPGIPLYDMYTMEDLLDRSLASERLVAYMAGGFGLVATVLAVMGLYGVTAYGVARRGREIGIRMALGAEAGAVVRMVLREVALLAGLGIGLALPAVWWLTQLVRSLLYGIEPRDPLTIAGSALGLLAVALLAGGIPALRASRLDPVKILRYE